MVCTVLRLIFAPMQFKDVIGQAAVKERLALSFKEGRISHAQLFFGPTGSGVLPLALAYAQFLTCNDRTDTDSCGKCPSCLRNSKLVHPDVHYSYPVVTDTKRGFKKPISLDYITEWRETVIPFPYLNYNDWVASIADNENKQATIMVEEAGDIVRKISMKAYEAPFKVVIMWLPEKMSAVVSNKMLKSIEEPPDNTIFILASEQRDQIIQTILSRTQLIKVNRLSDDEIANALMQRKHLSEEHARDIARLADGDFHLALELSREALGDASHETEFLNWMRLCFSPMKSMDKLQAWVDGMHGSGREKQKQFLFACIQTVRECMMINLADRQLVKIDNQQIQALDKFLPFVNAHNMSPFVEALNEAYYHIERNAHGKILFLDLSLKLSRILQIK